MVSYPRRLGSSSTPPEFTVPCNWILDLSWQSFNILKIFQYFDTQVNYYCLPKAFCFVVLIHSKLYVKQLGLVRGVYRSIISWKQSSIQVQKYCFPKGVYFFLHYILADICNSYLTTDMRFPMAFCIVTIYLGKVIKNLYITEIFTSLTS
jgi:hypothetical protein